MVVVDSTETYTSCNLLCSLFFITAHFEIAIKAVHIVGRDNSAAAAGKRDQK